MNYRSDASVSVNWTGLNPKNVNNTIKIKQLSRNLQRSNLTKNH